MIRFVRNPLYLSWVVFELFGWCSFGPKIFLLVNFHTMGLIKSEGKGKRFVVSNSIFFAASGVAECIIFPVDCLKTNMQVSNLKIKQTFRGLYSDGGVSRFYRGLQPAILRHWIYTNLRVGMYRPILDKLSGGHAKEDTNVGLRFVAGATSGAIGQFIANPTDLLKVKMQTGGYKDLKYGEAIRGIYNTEGFRGFYRGAVPNVQRAVLVNAGELAAYDTAKRFLINRMGFIDNSWCFLTASIMSGFCSTVLSCPADVVKSKLMSEGGHIYRGVLDCYVKTIRQDGFRGIYRGFFPTWMRLGPWHLIFWFTSENLRKWAGIETF